MRYALGVEYDGSNFKGWQRLTPYGQEGGPRTLQVTLEDALSGVASHPVEVICAGRTDAGVHAECQVVNFDSDARRDPRAWVLGTTTRLPPAMRVRWCVPVSDEFNARFSARARRYRYRLLNHQVRPALGRQYLAWERRRLDADAMHRAAQSLLGEQDFTSFRTVHCQASHPRRHLQFIEVKREGDIVTVTVQANAFLNHMVGIMVGGVRLIVAVARRKHG